jgi:3-keto-5-aminohexanoate cleavage enzyme
MSTRKTWLEVSLNGSWTRRRQPLIPVAVEEIVAQGIACARAGAAILHLHAYDAATGRQRDEAALYAAIIAGLRAQTDAIIYPTIPALDGAGLDPEERARRRYAAIAALAERGLLEWSVVDPGTVNLNSYDAIAAGRSGSVYLNPESDVRAGLALAERYRTHPSYAIYEPGFLRLGAALHRSRPGTPQPIYRLMFSDQLAFGFPPRKSALDAYLDLLALEAPGAPWMVAGLGVDILPLVPATVAAGGHVRVGLEDAPLGTVIDNEGWTRRAAAAIEAAGGSLASPAEVRAALGGTATA